MKNKIQSVVLLIIALVASALFWLLFELMDLFVISGDVNNIIYIAFKSFSLLMILLVWIYHIKKREASNTYILVYATILLQVLPFVVRLLGMGNPSSFLQFLIIFIPIISVLGFIAFFILIDRNNSKVHVLDKYAPKEIKVEDESSYYDSNGKFTGLKGKDD